MSSPQNNPRIKVGPFAQRPAPDTIPIGMLYIADDVPTISVVIGPGTPHTWEDFIVGGGVTGTGTLDTVAKWVSPTAIGDSKITDTGVDILLALPTRVAVDDAFNASVTKVLTAVHSAPGGGLPGVGAEFSIAAPNDAGLITDAADIDALFSATTAGLETSEIHIYTLVAGVKTLVLKIDGNGLQIRPVERLDTDSAGTLQLGTVNATDIAAGGQIGAAGLQRVYLNQGGVPLPLAPKTPSNAGMQYSSTFANRAQLRLNQFGNQEGVNVPGLSAFKSRGTTVGAIDSVIDGDVLFRVTAVGVAPNPPLFDVPLTGLISINVPKPGGSVPGNNWVAGEFEIELVPLEGPINGRKRVFKITSQGVPCLRETAAVAAPSNGKAAAVVALGAGGTLVILNSYVKAGTRFTLTVQDGGPAPVGSVYVAARVAGTGFTISSTSALDVGVLVYYQLWEATPA